MLSGSSSINERKRKLPMDERDACARLERFFTEVVDEKMTWKISTRYLLSHTYVTAPAT